MRNGLFMDLALLCISPASRGQLVKMLIALEPHGIFGPNCMLLYSNIVQPLVCKTETRLLGEFKTKSAENHNIYLKLKNMQIEIIDNNNILKTLYRNFARPAGVHYNHCVSPSVRTICFPNIHFGTRQSPRVVHITVRLS